MPSPRAQGRTGAFSQPAATAPQFDPRTTRWSPDSCRGEIPGAVAVTTLPHAAALQAITRAWPGAGAFVSAPVKGPVTTATRCARADRPRAWSTVDSPSAVAGNVCAVGYLLPGGGTVRRASNPPCPPEHCPPEVWREMESSAPPPSTGVKRWKDVASPSPVHTSGSVTTYPGWLPPSSHWSLRLAWRTGLACRTRGCARYVQRSA
jgi:hypothetical protein